MKRLLRKKELTAAHFFESEKGVDWKKI